MIPTTQTEKQQLAEPNAEKERLKQNKALYQKRYREQKKMEKQLSTQETNDHGEVLSIHMEQLEHSPSPQQMMHAETDPVAALMTLVTNTGHGRFADTTRITDNWSAVAQMNETQDIPDYIQNLRKEIEENVTKENTGPISKILFKPGT